MARWVKSSGHSSSPRCLATRLAELNDRHTAHTHGIKHHNRQRRQKHHIDRFAEAFRGAFFDYSHVCASFKQARLGKFAADGVGASTMAKLITELSRPTAVES